MEKLRLSPGMVVAGILMLLGFFSGIYSLIQGHASYGTSNDMPWGLLVAGYTFLVSGIGGCFIGSLGSVFGIKSYAPMARRAFFLAIVTVAVGMGVIFVELGQPFRMFLGYVASPNLTSPIWWMGVNYTLFLVLSVWAFFALGGRNRTVARVACSFAFLAALVADGSVGSVFGMVNARPFWYGLYLPADFMLCAWIIGFAMIALTVSLEKRLSAEKEQLLGSVRRVLVVLLGINLLFIAWKSITGLSAGGEDDKYLAAVALLKGPLSVRFWLLEIMAGLALPLILLRSSVANTMKKRIAVASPLIIFGLLMNKMNIVAAGQIVPVEAVKSDTYVRMGGYSLGEMGIVVGAVAFVVLFYRIADALYLNVPAAEHAQTEGTPVKIGDVGNTTAV